MAFKSGTAVVYVGISNAIEPSFYPPVGTVGTVIEGCDSEEILVQWKQGSTSEDDMWYVSQKEVRLLREIVGCA